MQRSGNGVPTFTLNFDHSRHFRPLIASVIQFHRYFIAAMSDESLNKTRTVRYVTYSDRLDLNNVPPIILADASREDLQRLIPFLLPPDEMTTANFPESEITAWNGEVADEIHDFENLTVSTGRVPRILLSDGQVAEVVLT